MATEYRLGYTGEEINRRLATVNEIKNNLENNYYTSTEVDTKFDNKADLVDGKVPVEQLPHIASDYPSLSEKPGDTVTSEAMVNFIDNQQLSGGQLVTQSIYQWGAYYADSAPKVGQTIHVLVTTSNGDKIDVGEGILYHDAELQSMMGGGNDGMWICCGINSTMTNVAQMVRSDSIPVANESIPYAFAIIITPSGDGGYVTVASTGNHNGISVTLQSMKKTTSVIKLPNEALTFDETPTSGSQNLVNSGVVYSEIDEIHSLMEEVFGSTAELIQHPNFGTLSNNSVADNPQIACVATKQGRHINGNFYYVGQLPSANNGNNHTICFNINEQYKPSMVSGQTLLPYYIRLYNQDNQYDTSTYVNTYALCRLYNSGIIEVIIDTAEYDSADITVSFDYWV